MYSDPGAIFFVIVYLLSAPYTDHFKATWKKNIWRANVTKTVLRSQRRIIFTVFRGRIKIARRHTTASVGVPNAFDSDTDPQNSFYLDWDTDLDAGFHCGQKI
jgi:hypothetical protein